MELQEILAALTEYVGDDKAKAKDVAFKLRNEADLKPIGSLIYNAGAARHKGETGTKLTDLEKQLATLTDEREDLAQQLEAAKGKPNEQLADAEKQRKKLEDRAIKAETDLKAERDGRTTDRVGHIAGRVASHLKGQVDDDYLSEVLTARIKGRVKPSENGKVELLAEDQTPYDGDGEAVEKELATDVLKAVPDKFRLRNMQPGGGVSGGGGQDQVTREQLIDQQARSGRFSLL